MWRPETTSAIWTRPRWPGADLKIFDVLALAPGFTIRFMSCLRHKLHVVVVPD